MIERRLLPVKDAAGYLGIKPSTLYAWAERRKVPSVKMGGRLLFDLKDLDLLIESNKRPVMRPEALVAPEQAE